MAYAKFDRLYRERMTDPRSYESLVARGRFLSQLGRRLESDHGVSLPRKMAHIVLLFGTFENRTRLQCQPWVAEPPGDGFHDFPTHADANREIRSKARALGFQGRNEPYADHRWYAFMGKDPSALDRYMVYVAALETREEFLNEKLAAVTTATKRGVLADHTIYAEYREYGRNARRDTIVRIQHGTAEQLTEAPFTVR